MKSPLFCHDLGRTVSSLFSLSLYTRRMNFPPKLNEMITAAAETSSVLTPSETLGSRLEVEEEEHFLGHVDLNQLDTVRPNCRQHAPSAAFAAGGLFARIDSGRFGTSEFNTMMMMIGELDWGRVELSCRRKLC